MGDGPEETQTPAGDERFDDPVDERIDESFPASDPPAGWAGEDPRDVEGQDGPSTGG